MASKPNDLAGKRRGFRSRSTPGNRNKNGIKPIGLDTHRLNTPLPTPSAKRDSNSFADPYANQFPAEFAGTRVCMINAVYTVHRIYRDRTFKLGNAVRCALDAASSAVAPSKADESFG